MHDTTKSEDPKSPSRKHNQLGEETPDPTPMQPPLGYNRTLSLSEQIAQQVRIAQLKILEDSALAETEDEADDFEVGDDFEPLSQYENDHMPTLANLKRQAKKINDAIEKRKLELSIQTTKDKVEKHEQKKAGAPAPAENTTTTE